jgi:hypothetical protein
MITSAQKFTAEQLYGAFTAILPIDEVKEREYSVIVKKLCAYFACDQRFESYTDFSLSKGIILFGGVGVGKTTLMQLFRVNPVFSYKIVPCREVESQFGTIGNEAIEYYSNNQPSLAVNSNRYGHTEIGYCFDDLGTENAVTKHFGNSKNVMTDVLLNRYDSKLDPRATHITTNLPMDEIEKYYGTRVMDRMRENFNLIAFGAKAQSRR